MTQSETYNPHIEKVICLHTWYIYVYAISFQPTNDVKSAEDKKKT